MPTDNFTTDQPEFRNTPFASSSNVTEFSRRELRAAASARESAVRSLRRAASTLRRTDGFRDKTKLVHMAQSTASSLDSAASYIETADPHRLMAEARTMVTRNPGRSMAAALILGFVAAGAMRRWH